ncbi:MAG: Endolytic murein transglycosylase [Candidatus Kaiserbacteria bacterium]|nr:Endolytic murein transglycosylase [Candidatus Kaiserbacteria bacterium]
MKKISDYIRGFFEWLDHEYYSFQTSWQYRINIRTILFLLFVGSLATWGYFVLFVAPDQFPSKVLITVPAGASATNIGIILEDQHVIRSAFTFRVIEKLLGASNTLHAGDYIFKQPENVLTVARAIAIGAYGLEPLHITIPEGYTVRQMAEIYAAQLPRFNKASFLTQAMPLEGFLFPDTYYFLPNVTETTVIAAMRQNFDVQIQKIQPQIASSTHTIEEITTMASIIEKEADTEHDRRMVSGVLWNRIAKGMPLQSDIPIMYVTGKYDSRLTLADLRNPSPYNTYVHKGLPIGPVNNPSIASILAAANPIKSDFLFYLSDKNNVTYYSKTYAQHLQYKALYIDSRK